MRGEINDYGPVFWAHLLFIASTYAFPFLFSLEWLALIGILLLLQDAIVGNCILNVIQFRGTDERSFYHYYLRKLGLEAERRALDKAIAHSVPAAILTATLVWQVLLGHAPLFF